MSFRLVPWQSHDFQPQAGHRCHQEVLVTICFLNVRVHASNELPLPLSTASISKLFIFKPSPSHSTAYFHLTEKSGKYQEGTVLIASTINTFICANATFTSPPGSRDDRLTYPCYLNGIFKWLVFIIKFFQNVLLDFNANKSFSTLTFHWFA